MALGDIFIDPRNLPDGQYGGVQLLFLLVVYGYILFNASNMISDGSELLLLVPSLAGLVGSIVLPVLGAVPDGAIVLFSGLGDNAQEELSVGVGALAGSTIMLLTIPWVLSIYGGRVNLDKSTGLAMYKRPHGYNSTEKWSKLMPSTNKSLLHTGVSGHKQLKTGGLWMLVTAIPFLIIQGPAFYFKGEGESNTEVSKKERPWALAGMIICFIMFVAYLYYQWRLASSGEDKVLEDYMEDVRRNKIMSGEITLVGAMQEELRRMPDRRASAASDNASESAAGATLTTPIAAAAHGGYHTSSSDPLESRAMLRLASLLKPFFERYDTDRSGSLDLDEIRTVFYDLHEHIGTKEFTEVAKHFDADSSGHVDYTEFVNGVAQYIMDKSFREKHSPKPSHHKDAETGNAKSKASKEDDAGEEGADEEEEVPEDLAHLSPEQQQRQIKLRSLWMMTLGTCLVLLFSDPMVGVLSEVGARTGIRPFFISFILAPLASNASELIAAYKYSLKKTSKTITISLSTLQGAACMNASFSLGIFLALVYFRHLIWSFSAETVAILVVEVIMAGLSFKQTHNLLIALFIISLYPLSLALVVGLEAVGWD